MNGIYKFGKKSKNLVQYLMIVNEFLKNRCTTTKKRDMNTEHDMMHAMYVLFSTSIVFNYKLTNDAKD